MTRVLVADDDSDVRDLVGFKLRHAGYTVDEAHDGPSALAQIRRQRPDLVLLDVMMPGMSGFAVCLELRMDPATRDLPVLLVTAKARDEDLERGMAAGSDGYIIKPFSPRDLLTRVQAALAVGAR